jgi:hypothetical protein
MEPTIFWPAEKREGPYDYKNSHGLDPDGCLVQQRLTSNPIETTALVKVLVAACPD